MPILSSECNWATLLTKYSFPYLWDIVIATWKQNHISSPLCNSPLLWLFDISSLYLSSLFSLLSLYQLSKNAALPGRISMASLFSQKYSEPFWSGLMVWWPQPVIRMDCSISQVHVSHLLLHILISWYQCVFWVFAVKFLYTLECFTNHRPVSVQNLLKPHLPHQWLAKFVFHP